MKLGMTKKKLGVASLLALVVTGGGLVMSGQQGISRVASALADPMSILADRSPGGRGAGALTQTKPSRVAPAAQLAANDPQPFTPIERVLSNVRSRPPVGDIAPVGVAPVPTGPMAAAVAPGSVAVGPSNNGIGPGGGTGPTLSTIGGGGGGGGGGSSGGGNTSCPPGSTTPECVTGTNPTDPTNPTNPTNPVDPTGPTNPVDPGNPTTPGVPEPATWAMLVTGFLGIGALLRRRRAAIVAAASPR